MRVSLVRKSCLRVAAAVAMTIVFIFLDADDVV
jgi:hypothetical protein